MVLNIQLTQIKHISASDVVLIASIKSIFSILLLIPANMIVEMLGRKNSIILGNIIKDSNRELLLQIAGIAVILGHTFPIFFGFKGGKGVATSLGVLLLSNWKIGLICLVFALVLMILTRMVSLGSCAAAVLFPVLTLFINENYIILTEGKKGSTYFLYSIILAAIVLFNHRSNIKRILDGTENKLGAKK